MHPLTESDKELAEILDKVRRIGAKLHVRGTDKNPVVELRERFSGKIIGGVELRRRLQQLDDGKVAVRELI